MLTLPKKTRDEENSHYISKNWDVFPYPNNTIVVASYIKSGTTWVQQIVGQLVFKGKENIPIADISPWWDFRYPSVEEKLLELKKQTHRLFVKTHLPASAMVFSEKAKYIYIGRDGRDVVWSMHNHYAQGNDLLYKILNDTPENIPAFERPSESKNLYFKEWLENDGHPIWSGWENWRTWWPLRNHPNVLLLHYNNLKDNLPGKMREIASFLDIKIVEEKFHKYLEHCSFDYMKKNATKVTPLAGIPWDKGAEAFVYKGIIGRWKDELLEKLSIKYEQIAVEKLGEECAHWLKTGEL